MFGHLYIYLNKFGVIYKNKYAMATIVYTLPDRHFDWHKIAPSIVRRQHMDAILPEVMNAISHQTNRKIDLIIDSVQTTDLDAYISSDLTRIALVHAIPLAIQAGTTVDPRPLRELKQTIEKLIQHSQLVIILDPELNLLHCQEWFKDYDSPNVCWLVGGIVNLDLKLFGIGNANQIICNPSWIHYVTHLYKNKKLSVLLSAVDPYEVRPKMFDILLGRKRGHRDFVYRTVNMNQKLADLSIMPYNPNSVEGQCLSGTDEWERVTEFYGKDSFLWEPNCIPLPNLRFTWDPVLYHGVGTFLSLVAPLSIYRQTAYSVVAETSDDNRYSFFTEKIAKPIIARRLFIVISGQYYLRNLRRLGFATFDGIIDESYDLEPNDTIRWYKAIEQMKWLAEQPQEVIFEQIRGRVEHNFKYAIDQDWSRFARGAVDQWLKQIK